MFFSRCPSILVHKFTTHLRKRSRFHDSMKIVANYFEKKNYGGWNYFMKNVSVGEWLRACVFLVFQTIENYCLTKPYEGAERKQQ